MSKPRFEPDTTLIQGRNITALSCWLGSTLKLEVLGSSETFVTSRHGVASRKAVISTESRASERTQNWPELTGTAVNFDVAEIKRRNSAQRWFVCHAAHCGGGMSEELCISSVYSETVFRTAVTSGYYDNHRHKSPVVTALNSTCFIFEFCNVCYLHSSTSLTSVWVLNCSQYDENAFIHISRSYNPPQQWALAPRPQLLPALFVSGRFLCLFAYRFE